MEVEAVLMPLRWSRLTLPVGWCRLLAACLILGACAAHLIYQAHQCPIDLAPDEAHYWDWSRHLDFSYYSKGPLVAYLIRGGCEVAGSWSVAHTGNLAFAVRLPAILCGSLLLLSLYVLTVQVYRCETLAVAVVGMALTLPLISVGSSLMTIDAPYTCCWGWALVLGHRAIFRESKWAWPLLGVVLGLGMLAKYTMIVWLPSVGLFLLTTPTYRHLLLRRGFWCMVAVAGLCCLPILIWNAQHDWVTFRHVFGLAGLRGEVETREPSRIHWLGPLTYIGEQCALLLVYWFLVWAAAMIAHRPWRESDDGVRYLWWLSAPMFLLFLAFSPKTGGGEMNWPVTAYLSGMVLSAAWLMRRFDSPRRWVRIWTAINLGLACSVGLTMTLFMHHSDWLYPVLAKVAGPPTKTNLFPLRRFDPSCRLRGWRTLAEGVDRLRAQLVEEGVEPVLAGCSWNMPGELGVYCSGHPQAYSIGPSMGDRHSQYDLWFNPLDDGAAFHGRTFIIVNGDESQLRRAFGSVEPAREVPHFEQEQLISSWRLSVCRDFRGTFPPLRKGGGRHY